LIALPTCQDMGAAYGTAKSALGIASLGINDDSSVMKNIIPVVMAGVLGIYGLIVSVIIVQGGWLIQMLRFTLLLTWRNFCSSS